MQASAHCARAACFEEMAERSDAQRTTETILDAARDVVVEMGVRRATLSEISRRAGVSRMSVYRRYPDVTAVLRELMTREFGAGVAGARSAVEGLPTARERLVTTFVHALTELRGHELWRAVVDRDPELLVPYVFERMGETQRITTAVLRAEVEAGQADGSIRAGDPAVLAHAALLVIQGFAMSAAIDPAVAEADVLPEVAPALDGLLTPR
jgi:AcrR family transcriptional regulator